MHQYLSSGLFKQSSAQRPARCQNLTMSNENVAPTPSHSQISLAIDGGVTEIPRKIRRRSSATQACANIVSLLEPQTFNAQVISPTWKPTDTHTPSKQVRLRSSSQDSKQGFASGQLTNCLHAAGGDEILEDYDINILWTASKDPPITRRSLEELDFHNLKRCVHLRHDLNFDADIQFRRNDAGLQGSHRIQQAQCYWEAVEIELALYQLYWKGLTPERSTNKASVRSPFPAPGTFHGMPLRLTSLIVTIRRIAICLLPRARHAALQARLDTDLLIQEMDHGQLNLKNTIESVGMLLLDVCSPLRDELIDSMMSVISHGCQEDDPQIICLGIQELFSVMETMRLDIANYQIYSMRKDLLTDCIAFEQQQLLDSFEHGWSVPNWLHGISSEFSDDSMNTFQTFLVGFHTLLVNRECLTPQAFVCDYQRIHILRVDFHTLLFHAAYLRTFDTTLQKLRWKQPVSELSHENLLRRLVALERDVLVNQSQQRDTIVLEIVREAFAFTKTDSLPTPELLTCAAQVLQKATDGVSDIFNSLRRSLAKQLLDLLIRECDVIRDFDAVKMAATAELYLQNHSDGWLSVSIESIARSAAHVAMVHWKVWAPVLYLRESRDGEQGASGTENVAED